MTNGIRSGHSDYGPSTLYEAPLANPPEAPANPLLL